jgi:asparagine synthase (glutamine-hydrolysing)
MSVSLEAREPLLDHRLVEFAWTLPLTMKSRPGKGKLVLRDVLRRHLPEELIERPKMGFGIPLDAWLRGPLRDWGEELLSAASFAQHGLIDDEPVRVMWQEHVSGRRQWQHHLWSALMFQAWYRESF